MYPTSEHLVREGLEKSITSKMSILLKWIDTFNGILSKLKGWGFFLYVEINKLILKVMEMLMIWKSQHNIEKMDS